MDKPSLMFDAQQFTAASGATRDDSSAARSEQDVMMWLEGGVGLAGAGVAWGQGQMNFQGDNHLFRVSCLSIGDAGAAGMYATGRVMGLRKISDFSGNYRASSRRPSLIASNMTCFTPKDWTGLLDSVV